MKKRIFFLLSLLFIPFCNIYAFNLGKAIINLIGLSDIKKLKGGKDDYIMYERGQKKFKIRFAKIGPNVLAVELPSVSQSEPGLSGRCAFFTLVNMQILSLAKSLEEVLHKIGNKEKIEHKVENFRKAIGQLGWEFKPLMHYREKKRRGKKIKGWSSGTNFDQANFLLQFFDYNKVDFQIEEGFDDAVALYSFYELISKDPTELFYGVRQELHDEIKKQRPEVDFEKDTDCTIIETDDYEQSALKVGEYGFIKACYEKVFTKNNKSKIFYKGGEGHAIATRADIAKVKGKEWLVLTVINSGRARTKSLDEYKGFVDFLRDLARKFRFKVFVPHSDEVE